jgi:hypothetical protein
MPALTPEGTKRVAEIAARHGVSGSAVETMLQAVANGYGTQAQFNIGELGGMGQWSQGGMTMVGDMFNHGLKARVDALCSELARLLASEPDLVARPSGSYQAQSSGSSLFVAGGGMGHQQWPADLGAPSSAGAQNSMRYAVFPQTRRLAIDIGGQIDIYDTGDHQISGVSQQQSGDQSLTFTSQLGLVRVADLPKVTTEIPETQSPPSPAPTVQPQAPIEPERSAAPVAAPAQPKPSHAPSDMSADAIFAMLPKLAKLRDDGILSEDEFAAKKAELLARL